MKNYIAIIHKESGSDFGVCFPDFPGCITAGTTLDEAKTMAQEALEGHVAVCRDHGDPIPEPMGLESAMAHEFAEDALVFFVVSLADPEPKAVRLNVSLPWELVQAVDRHAREHGMSRSASLAKAARKALEVEA